MKTFLLVKQQEKESYRSDKKNASNPLQVPLAD